MEDLLEADDKVQTRGGFSLTVQIVLYRLCTLTAFSTGLQAVMTHGSENEPKSLVKLTSQFELTLHHSVSVARLQTGSSLQAGEYLCTTSAPNDI